MSPSAAAAVLEYDSLLAEILLRLPSQPSSLPRASAVSKRWHSLASDPAFARRFRRHHRRNPPLLGCFMENGKEIRFEPTLDPPNRVPQARFSLLIKADRCFEVLGCRHGFLLILQWTRGQAGLELLVWDPVNGHEHPLAFPPGFSKILTNGAVLRSSLGDMQNFQVVLVSTDIEQRVIACVYSSETGVWGNLITTPLPPNVSDISPAEIAQSIPAVLVGDSIYMLLLGKSSSIVQFNVDKHSLAVIPLPVGLYSDFSRHCWVVRADDGGLGFLFLSMSDCSAQSWKRTTDSDGIASWVLARTIELDKLLPLNSQNRNRLLLEAFAEENNVLFLWTFLGVFMIQLDSLKFKKIPEIDSPGCHPFEAVYDAGIKSDIPVVVIQERTGK